MFFLYNLFLQILKHLLSLCENKPTPSAVSATNDDGTEADSAAATTSTTLLNRVQACAAAALCKELLKLDTSKVAKAVDKEYIKLLASLNLQDWIALYDVSFSELSQLRYLPVTHYNFPFCAGVGS